MTESCLDRRAFVFTVIGGLKGAQAWAQSVITRPVVSEQACPLEIIHPTANDGHRGPAGQEAQHDQHGANRLGEDHEHDAHGRADAEGIGEGAGFVGEMLQLVQTVAGEEHRRSAQPQEEQAPGTL